MRKICVVTGSRAEYGILRGLMKAIKDDPELQLQIIATNQHLSKLQGETYKEIEHDGFTIDYKVFMADDEAPDNVNTTAKSISRGVAGFADAFEALLNELNVTSKSKWSEYDQIIQEKFQGKVRVSFMC